MSSETDEELINYLSEAGKTLKRYDPDNCSITSWEREFLNVVKNLNVPDSKKATLFCLMLENRIYTALKRYLSPRHPAKLSYKDLVRSLKKCPVMISQTTNRQRFRARKQHDDETMLRYARNLKFIYRKCNYKYADEGELVAHFLDGLRNRDIAKYLKKAKILVYKVAVERALLLEKQGEASTSKD